MFKVANKKVIMELAQKTYSANRKKNVLTVIAIFLTTFLIADVLLLGSGYYQALTLRQRRMNGMDYDIALTEPTQKQVEMVRTMDRVKYAGVCVKCAILTSYENQPLDKVRLFWVDETCYEKQVIPALASHKGTYPVKENEIMLSESVLYAMGIKHPSVGMQIPVSYQTLKEGDTEVRFAKFRLNGYYVDYTDQKSGYVSKVFYEQTGVKQTDFTQGSLKITLRNPLYSKSDMLRMYRELDLSKGQIIESDEDSVAEFVKVMIGIGLFLLFVFVSGYLFIYNIQYISVRQDIRYYGQLKTLGTTSKQLRKLVQIQLLWNAGMGIVSGVLLVFLLGNTILQICMKEINPNVKVQKFDVWMLAVLAVAVIFSLAVALWGSRKPRRMAEMCTPVEAMKYICAGNLTGNENKMKFRQSKGGNVTSMAVRNLFRDKKQFVVIMLSLSMAVALFLVVNSVIMSNNARYILDEVSDADMKVLNLTLLEDDEKQVLTDDLIRKIRALDGVKQVRKLTGTTVCIPYQKVYEDYYKNLYASRYSPGDYDADMEYYKAHPAWQNFTCRMIGVDDAEFEKLNVGVAHPLDKEEFQNGKVCFFTKAFTQGENGITGKTVEYEIPVNDETIAGRIKIGAMLEANPAYYSAGYSPDLIVSESYVRGLIGEEALTEMIKIDYVTSYDKAAEKQIRELLQDYKEISKESKLSRYSEMKQSEGRIRLLGNTIAFLIAALAFLNFINMMSASLENRRSEFAILESIGMTRGQLRGMVTCEAVCYAVLSIGCACMAGFPVSYAAFRSACQYEIPFRVPIVGDLMVFAALVAGCVVTANVAFSRMKEMSVVELLKSVG